MRSRIPTMQGTRRNFWVFVLIGFVLAAMACSSGVKTSTGTFVSLGSPEPPITAREVLARAIAHADSAVSVRSEGVFFSYGPAQGIEREEASELQAVRFTTEWAAPDRTRHATISPDGDRAETITIGQRSYTRRVDGFEKWREFPATGNAANNPALFLLDNLEVDEPFEVIDYRGADTYRLAGRPDDESLVFFNQNGKSVVQDTVFIDVSSNVVVRFERVIGTCVNDVDCVEPSPTVLQVVPSALPNFLEQWFEFTFPGAPFEIDVPVNL